MNGTNVTHGGLTTERTERSLRVFAGGGSMVEAIGGIAAIVLAIIGLSGALQNDMLAIATIVLGASLVLEGGAIAASYRRAMFSLEGSEGAELGGAATIEFLAGFTGIVLGVLALIGVGGGGALMHFVSTSVIVFGAALLLSSSSVSQLNSFWSQYSSDGSRFIAQSASDAKSGGQMLVGLAAVVLGVLALLNINTMVLNFVALLALGVSVLLSGSAFGARTMLHKRA